MASEFPEDFPSNEGLCEYVINALHELGGSGTNQEIYDTVVKILNLPYDVEKYRHLGSITQSELYYRTAWAKTILKKKGIITNSSRGIWTLSFEKTQKPGETTEDVSTTDSNIEVDGFEKWRTDLLSKLQSINPFSFEVLTQRLLRECGFESVTVTKKTGDGGIDGYGKLMVNGIFSFNVAFQCKRYSGSVSPKEIRDFRGSLPNSIEKGVFITTGTFTESAEKEASDPGKKQIDLIDGNELIEKLKNIGLGVKKQTIYTVDEDYFYKLEKSIKYRMMN